MIIFQGYDSRNCRPTRIIQISSMRIKYFEPHITITIGCNSNTPYCYYEISVAFRYERLKGSLERRTVLISLCSNFLVNSTS